MLARDLRAYRSVDAFWGEFKAPKLDGRRTHMHMRAENLILRAERWPALTILVASCAMMTAAALWL
jgi:ferric-dicitrate binding protein FerR (iron transport regulator)